MIIETTISIEVLAPTGYTSWLDFATNITGITSTLGVNRYECKDSQGQKKELTVELSPKLVERLALEEARTWLPLLNIARFSDYQMLIDNGRMRETHNDYCIDTVVRNKQGKVELSRIRINVDKWKRLLSWEEKYKDEFSFIEHPDNFKA